MHRVDVVKASFALLGVVLAMAFVITCAHWRYLEPSDVKAFAFLIIGIAAPSPLAGTIQKISDTNGRPALAVPTPIPVTKPKPPGQP